MLSIPGAESFGVPPAVLGGVLGLVLLGGGLLLARRWGTDREGQSRVTGAGGGGSRTRRTDEASSTPRAAPPIRTDEELVVQLLIANHGRMKQSQIVEETDWSKAKVSRLLSRMEEQDQIVRTRAGRENIVQLADANLSVST